MHRFVSRGVSLVSSWEEGFRKTNPGLAAAAGYDTGLLAVGTVTDSGAADDLTVRVAWGDGQTSTATLFDNHNGTFTIGAGHTYAAVGSYPVTLTAADDGPAVTATATVVGWALGPGDIKPVAQGGVGGGAASPRARRRAAARGSARLNRPAASSRSARRPCAAYSSPRLSQPAANDGFSATAARHAASASASASRSCARHASPSR